MLCGWPLAASALISEPFESGLEVIGVVDTDSFGPLPPLSSQQVTVTTLPLAVSSIAIADSAGLYDYSASADIGLLELKVFGMLDNGTGSTIGNGETAVMNVQAQVLDVITLNSTLTTPYDVSFQLKVDGSIFGSGSFNARANALIDFGLLGELNGDDIGSYTTGPIDDLLSVTRTVSGATVDMDLNARLIFAVTSIDAGASVTGQLNNTAVLQLVLPAGVTLAGSASGTFGVPIAAVPEPGSWALMMGGLVLLGRFAVRRQNRAGD